MNSAVRGLARNLSLRQRFGLLILLLVLGVTLLLGLIAWNEASRLMRQSIGESAADVAFQMADKLDRDMASRVQEVRLLAEALSFENLTDTARIRAQLEQLQESYEVASWIGFTGPQGTVRAGTGGILEGVSIAHRPVYLNGREGLWLGDVHEAVMLAALLPGNGGEPIKFVDIAAPVPAPDGGLQGVLAVHLSWEWASHLMSSMFSPLQLQHGLELFVVAADGAVLLGPEGWIGDHLDMSRFAELDQRGPRGWQVQDWRDGRFLTGYALSDGYGAFDGFGWTVLSRKPERAAFAPLQTLRQEIALGGAGLALLFALLGWWVTTRLSAPLLRLAAAADRIGPEDSAERIPLQQGSPELRRLSASLRGMVARLQEQHRAINRLEDLAHSDRLTGLPNRAFLEQYLPHAQAEVQRKGTVLVLIYMDLDGFKRINDDCGHAVGDQVLRIVAGRLREQLRGEDLAVRLGGDEFVLVLKAERAQLQRLMAELAERVLNAVAEPMQVQGESGDLRVGASLGAAWWPDHGEPIEQVLRHADEALYRAKHAGKHRLWVHGEENDDAARTGQANVP